MNIQVDGKTIADDATVIIDGAAGTVEPKHLPYDAEIEYLESTGTQYIDTGIMAHSNIGWKIDGQILVGTNDFTVLIGAQDSGDKWYYEIFDENVGIAHEAYNGGKPAYSLEGYINTRTIATFNFLGDGMASINPSMSQTDRVEVDLSIFKDQDVTYCLFAAGSNSETESGHAMSFSKSRIYSFQMTDGDIIVRDFVPVRVGTEGCMYDKVSGKLF